ncbi:phosphoenolpyruvate--protein phosphotransferase [Catenovulum sediminis]|uniref:phosphoenolpyruvate--protein phosphotransferase n=1 Tax=Catenovulum sediminis TaxID=1740262 RepID=A0ABV1RMH1_9ALTE|nr:phosphoenolpyruvate--protein phosphotransferase [Catenovulum sediminis]
MLTTLKRIVDEVNRQPVLEKALESVAKLAKDAMHTECCSIYLADEENKHYLLMATDGLSQSAVGSVAIGFDEGLVGLVGKKEEPVNIANARTHPRFLVTPQVLEESYNSFLGAPIIHQRHVVGVISVQHSRHQVFDDSQVAFLVTLAAQLGSAIAHAEAREALDRTESPALKSRARALRGVAGSNGIALGKAYVIQPQISFASIVPRRTHNIGREIVRFKQAVKKTQQELKVLSGKMTLILPSDTSAIFDVYNHMLNDDLLGEKVQNQIHNGWNAATALKIVIEDLCSELGQMEDSYIRERITDIRDIGQRVLTNLIKKEMLSRPIPDNLILVAEEVTASMLAEIPREKLNGICSVRGSNNSHAAILARALGIPAVMGLEDLPLTNLDGRDTILDGYSGQVFFNPDAVITKEYKVLLVEEKELDALVQSIATESACTRDGTRVSLNINTGLAADFEVVRGIDADGIGLYRTEIPFMVRNCFPSEQEQCELYEKALDAYPGKPVNMRTLDVGGDKPLPYFPIKEDNPFLGWRGIRMTLDHPEILLVQVRAMLKANIGRGNLQILLPMVTSVQEVEECLRLINQAYAELCEEYQCEVPKPKIGAMLEVPAAIYQIGLLSRLVDYFSVGTNDLTQYLLAVDRNNARVASLYDYYHPGVIEALHYIAKQCKKYNVPVSVCGEMAGEPIGLLLLVSMGYRNFSMSAQNLLKAKWVLKHISLEEVESLLQQTSQVACPQQIKNLVAQKLDELGLGGFIRAGK